MPDKPSLIKIAFLIVVLGASGYVAWKAANTVGTEIDKFLLTS